MFEALFGVEMPLALRFFLAFVFVLALIGGAAYLVRRFGSKALQSATAARGRQHRLALIDSTPVDGRRRLLLIRRDNVEHLIMVGGPTDVVVEANIVRAAPATARETVPARATAPQPETMPRPAPLPESGMWPSQSELAIRPQRVAPFPEETTWPLQPQPEPAVRPNTDRLAGLAADLSRVASQTAETSSPRAPVSEVRRLVPTPEPMTATSDEQNLADMAQRLEAALRRPAPASDAAPVETIPTSVVEPLVRPDISADLAKPLGPRPVPNAETVRSPNEAKPVRIETKARPEIKPIRPESKPVRPENKPVRPESKPAAKTVYENLEQEMASLLGRPAGKS